MTNLASFFFMQYSSIIFMMHKSKMLLFQFIHWYLFTVSYFGRFWLDSVEIWNVEEVRCDKIYILTSQKVIDHAVHAGNKFKELCTILCVHRTFSRSCLSSGTRQFWNTMVSKNLLFISSGIRGLDQYVTPTCAVFSYFVMFFVFVILARGINDD